MWFVNRNNSQRASPRQLIAGMEGLSRVLVEKEMSWAEEARRPHIIASHHRLFHKIQLLINFPDLDKQFIRVDPRDPNFHSEYNLWNPRSKAVFLVLWFFSIEPPVYFQLNCACR